MEDGDNRFAAWLRGQLGAAPGRSRRTQGQLAQRLGVATSTVSRWTTGTSYPEPQNVQGIAAYLGVPVEEVAALLPRPWEARAGGRAADVRELAEAVAEFAGQYGVPPTAEMLGRLHRLFERLERYQPDADPSADA